MFYEIKMKSKYIWIFSVFFGIIIAIFYIVGQGLFDMTKEMLLIKNMVNNETIIKILNNYINNIREKGILFFYWSQIQVKNYYSLVLLLAVMMGYNELSNKKELEFRLNFVSANNIIGAKLLSTFVIIIGFGLIAGISSFFLVKGLVGFYKWNLSSVFISLIAFVFYLISFVLSFSNTKAVVVTLLIILYLVGLFVPSVLNFFIIPKAIILYILFGLIAILVLFIYISGEKQIKRKIERI